MVLVANLTNIKNDAKILKSEIETLANWYSSESTQWQLSNEYQLDRVYMVFKNLCALVLRTEEASALEGLSISPEIIVWNCDNFGNYFGIEKDFIK